jgi:hypothetical protein
VRSGSWRILVGDDAKTLDAAIRAEPEAAYDYLELAKAAAQAPRGDQGPKTLTSRSGLPTSPRVSA